MPKKKVAIFLIAGFVGLILIMICPVFTGEMNLENMSFFSIVKNGIEKLSFITLGNLFICGLILGWIFPEHPTLCGVSTVAFLPIIAIVDWETSHNLMPIEFFIYSCMALPAILGARITAKNVEERGSSLKSRNGEK